jgi:phosphoribosyl-AMP cyclohydrolase
MKTTLNNNLILKCLASAFAMIMFSACSKEKNRELAPAALYQKNGMHPVSSSFNQKKQVISILYANEVARNGVNTGNQKYTLVTWKQKPHPLWFGGNTNGEILSVEKINLSKTEKGISNIHYQKQLAYNSGKTEENMNVRERIRYILEQKFSKFPG